MKKILLLTTATALSFSMTNIIAKPAACNYTDHFHLSPETPASIKIQKLSGDNNVIVSQVTDRDFDIKDTSQCPPEGGNAKVTYGSDDQHFCDLNIHDGELEWDPHVIAACHGLAYNGITYDGTGTYRYTLHFSIQQ